MSRSRDAEIAVERLIVIWVLGAISVFGLIGVIVLNVLGDDAQVVAGLTGIGLGSLGGMLTRRRDEGDMEQLGRDAIAGMLRQVAGLPHEAHDFDHDPRDTRFDEGAENARSHR